MVGQTIGHYQITEKLGEGGMGVVYRATDTKLNRPVALKFLPEHITASERDVARFVQEAQAAAALNHPNICTIHGIDEADSKHFIVMEFVDGQMLSEKMSSVSMRQAIETGIQIAEGLAAAHEKGIVHRDMKPENVMVRKDGIVQIMDFGLAKLRGASRLTKEGSTVGTAGYMSPEQVQGQETDHRSDIFSLGVMLYEMLTGQPPFKGMHETAIAYEIVNVDSPPMSAIKPEITPELDAIVLDCLEKDPKERTQAASQVALELKRYRRESSRQRASRITAARPIMRQSSSAQVTHDEQILPEEGARYTWKHLAAAIGVVIVLAAAGFAAASFVLDRTGPGQPLWVTIEEPDGLRFTYGRGGNTTISPDGRHLAFVATDSAGADGVFIRDMETKTVARIPESQGAIYPFWSPDGRSIGYFAAGKMKRADIAGGPSLTVADARDGRGGAWSPKGVIVYAPDTEDKDLYIVPADGGAGRRLTDLDSAGGTNPRFPFFLPDGEHFLFVTLEIGGGASTARDDFKTYVGDLDGSVTALPLTGVSNVMYASGHLVYLRQGTLIAQPFDPDTYELRGSPVPIQSNVNFWPQRAKGDFTVSQSGLLLFAPVFKESVGELLWVDRKGGQTQITRTNAGSAKISPDGQRISYESDVDGNTDIWIHDLNRGVISRFTFDLARDLFSFWSRDGKTVYYSNGSSGEFHLFRKRSDGLSKEERFVAAERGSVYGTEVSPDGRFLLWTRFEGTGRGMIGYSPVSDGNEQTELVRSGFQDYGGSFSPDGRWFAFASNESGKDEVYIRPFPQDGAKIQVSSGGGSLPWWKPSGEIFFRSGSAFVSVRVDLTGGVPRLGPQTALFSVGAESGLNVYDITPDGKRFLAQRNTNQGEKHNLSLLVNWDMMVEKKGNRE